MIRRSRRALTLGALAAATLTSLALAPSSGLLTATAAIDPHDCPTGTSWVAETTIQDLAAGVNGSCRPAVSVESFEEMQKVNAGLDARRATGSFGDVSAAAYPAGVAAAARVAAAGPASPTSTWKQYAKTAEIFDVAGYNSVNGLGLADVAGRIEDLAYVPGDSQHWFAAIANGGVFETTTAGASWKSIGDTLPTQITGAVGYTPAAGGTVIVGSGDPAFGGSSSSGLGAYWTTNHGATWTKSKGVPDGTISFAIAIDPTNTSRAYLATGKGLYRTNDAGRSFTNVVLPTTCTNIKQATCFFSNIVTDVVVRANDAGGTGGGRVLAAVGWRAGTKLNAENKPQSPRNGLYTSATGAPGTFTFLGGPAGFAEQTRIGRTALAAANGPAQDHDYVFAVVQDADKFNQARTAVGGAPEPGALPAKVPGNTVLNGVYGSSDFGLNWTKIADSAQLAASPGTALVGANTASYAPGIQSWYNSWFAVDPSSADPTGAPSRIAFGLEEVWENVTPIVLSPVGSPVPAPADPPSGAVQFKVIGRYFGGTSCLGLNTNGLIPGGAPFCPANGVDTPSGPTTTTHPDQHAGMFVPTGEGVTLVAGNDGGAYSQTVTSGQDFTNAGWGRGKNTGMDTLLPYDAAMAKDGTIWIGLQDNGTAKITPQGKVIATFGGDGFFVATDPDNSNVAYEEVTNGAIKVTRDGGKTWTAIAPTMTGALFGTPFKMDPTDADHLVIGGREIFETTRGAGTSASTWKQVFNLGTRTKPGNASAAAGTGDPVNSQSAIDTRGDATYVGYCGYCDIVTGGIPFNSGIATNVGGADAPSAGTTDGWHIAAAKGLPKRYITSVSIDPKNAKTVYVTLGGYGRRWIPPGSLGDDVSKIGVGHVYKSTDAGATFKDVSGNLPDLPANHVLPYDGRLIVSTDVGVYVSSNSTGGTYRVLGKGLPAVPTFEVSISPRNHKELVAATYGRSVFTTLVGNLGAVSGGSTGGTAKPPTSGGGGLPATGAVPAVGAVALLLLGAGLFLRRRRHA